MDERPANANAAIDIMRQWQWLRGDPDGNIWPISLELHEVANRLAMEGIPRPQDALLSLLCSGELSAHGDYRWRKHQGGEYFQHEDTGAPIKQRQWQVLAKLIEVDRLDIENGGFGYLLRNLPKLGMQNCAPFDWAFSDNRFSIALCPVELSGFDPNYVEEWFSAWNIEVSRAWPDDDLLNFDSEPDAPATKPATNRGGAPRKWDWDGALLHLAALAHHGANGLLRDDGRDPNQSDIARHLQAWFINTSRNSPEDSQLREYGKRFVTELNALKLRDAKNLKGGK